MENYLLHIFLRSFSLFLFLWLFFDQSQPTRRPIFLYIIANPRPSGNQQNTYLHRPAPHLPARPRPLLMAISPWLTTWLICACFACFQLKTWIIDPRAFPRLTPLALKTGVVCAALRWFIVVVKPNYGAISTWSSNQKLTRWRYSFCQKTDCNWVLYIIALCRLLSAWPRWKFYRDLSAGRGKWGIFGKKRGLNRDLNPGPLAPKARIIPLDHWASCFQRPSFPFRFYL